MCVIVHKKHHMEILSRSKHTARRLFSAAVISHYQEMTSWHESFILQFTIGLKKNKIAEARGPDFIWIILIEQQSVKMIGITLKGRKEAVTVSPRSWQLHIKATLCSHIFTDKALYTFWFYCRTNILSKWEAWTCPLNFCCEIYSNGYTTSTWYK